MKKLSIEKIKNLLISAGNKKNHEIEFKKDPWPYEIVAVCKWCDQSAQFDRKKYDQHVWSPWWGSLISDKFGPSIKEEPYIEDCWGYAERVKEEQINLKRKDNFKKIAIKIIKTKPTIEEIVNILEDIHKQALESNVNSIL